LKLLKISVSGLPLFGDICEIDFVAMQRVTSDNAEKMSVLFSSATQTFFQNNVLAFIGINASGTTRVFAESYTMGHLPFEGQNVITPEVLQGQRHLETTIAANLNRV